MRLHFLPILSLLLRACASSFDLREPAPHHLDARDTSDVCAVISGKIPVYSSDYTPEPLNIGELSFHRKVYVQVLLCC